jgi:hypothetical protein
MSKIKKTIIKQPKPKHIKKIDYGINIWNPEFGLYKNTTKDSETPPDIIIENQIEGAAWNKIRVSSSYYFNPTEINLAKLLYGAMVNLNHKEHSNLTREEQDNTTFHIDLIEMIKLYFPDLSADAVKTKKRQFQKTVKKLMHLHLYLGREGEKEGNYRRTSFFENPLLEWNKELNKSVISFRYSEWFDIERKVLGDKRTITNDFLVYQHIDTSFPEQLERFNKEEHSQYIKTVLTHFKSLFDFKNGLKCIEQFNVRKDIEEIVGNWEDLKRPTQRQYLGAYITAFETIENDQYFSKYFKRVGGGSAATLPGLSVSKTKGAIVIYDIYRF